MCADHFKTQQTSGHETTGQLRVETLPETSRQESSGEDAKTHGLSQFANMHVSFCPV